MIEIRKLQDKVLELVEKKTTPGVETPATAVQAPQQKEKGIKVCRTPYSVQCFLVITNCWRSKFMVKIYNANKPKHRIDSILPTVGFGCLCNLEVLQYCLK
jgi:hypothetical protein